VQFNKIVDVSSLVPSLADAVFAGHTESLNTMLLEAEIAALLSAPADFEAAVTETGGSDRSSGTGASDKMGSVEQCNEVFTAKVNEKLLELDGAGKQLKDITLDFTRDFAEDGKRKCDAINNGKKNGPFTRDRIERIAEKYFYKRAQKARDHLELIRMTANIKQAYIRTLGELIRSERNVFVRLLMFRSIVQNRLDPAAVPATADGAEAKAREVFGTMREAAAKQVDANLKAAYSNLRMKAQGSAERKARGGANESPEQMRQQVYDLFTELANSLTDEDVKSQITKSLDSMVDHVVNALLVQGKGNFDEIKKHLVGWFWLVVDDTRKNMDSEKQRLQQELLKAKGENETKQKEIERLSEEKRTGASLILQSGIRRTLATRTLDTMKGASQTLQSGIRRASAIGSLGMMKEAEEAQRATGSAEGRAKPNAYVLVKSTNGTMDQAPKTPDEYIVRYNLRDQDQKKRIIPEDYQVSVVGEYKHIENIDDPSAVIVIIDKMEGDQMASKTRFLPICKCIYLLDKVDDRVQQRLTHGDLPCYEPDGTFVLKANAANVAKSVEYRYKKYKFKNITVGWYGKSGCSTLGSNKRMEFTKALLKSLGETRPITIKAISDPEPPGEAQKQGLKKGGKVTKQAPKTKPNPQEHDLRALGYLVAYCDTPGDDFFASMREYGPRRVLVLSKWNEGGANQPGAKLLGTYEKRDSIIIDQAIVRDYKELEDHAAKGRVLCEYLTLSGVPGHSSSFGTSRAATRVVPRAVMRRFV
jgi:hypothetical protein